MASIFGNDGGTLTDGRRRRPTNAGYGSYPYGTPSTTTPGGGAVPRGTSTQPQSDGPAFDDGSGRTREGGGSPRTNPGYIPPPPTGDPTEPEPPFQTEPKAPAARKYASIPGLDTGKLGREDYKTYKYGDAARAFSSFVGGGGKVGRNALDDLVQYARETFGLTGARVVGDDKVDFGDGSGPIDLILSDGGLWWGQEGPGGSGSPDPFTTAGGGGDPFAGVPGGNTSTPDMSWLADLIKGLTGGGTSNTPAAPPVVVNVPGQQPSYSQPSPTFNGGYVQPGFAPTGDGMMDATTLLSLALPKLLQNPDALKDPLVRQILQMTQGRG